MSRWWYPLAPALPFLLPQALWVRRTTLRLEDASQPAHGVVIPPETATDAVPLRLLLIGESTVAGVGVQSHDQALSGQLALQLAGLHQRPVAWQAAGRNGARAGDCRRELLPLVTEDNWDLVIIVLGVNDTTHLTPRSRWRRHVTELIRAFDGRAGKVLVTGVPPLGRFPALPQPLRGWLGLRAGLLDSDLRQLAPLLGARHLDIDIPFEPVCMARDGYHPSAEGYRRWAAGIVSQLEAGAA